MAKGARGYPYLSLSINSCRFFFLFFFLVYDACPLTSDTVLDGDDPEHIKWLYEKVAELMVSFPVCICDLILLRLTVSGARPALQHIGRHLPLDSGCRQKHYSCGSLNQRRHCRCVRREVYFVLWAEAKRQLERDSLRPMTKSDSNHACKAIATILIGHSLLSSGVRQ